MRFQRVLLDIEAQRDFFSPGGACFSRFSLKAARNVRRLFAWARRGRVPIISTVLRIRPGGKGPLAPTPHCIEGTNGEKRISGTLLPRHIDLGMRNITDLPRNIYENYQQVIFEMRFTNIFAHSRIERLLTELEAEAFVVCGAGSAHGIVEAVVAMRARHLRVILAADAILDLDDPGAEFAWLRMLAKGALPLSTDEIIAAMPGKKKPSGRLCPHPSPRRDGALTG